MADHRLLLTIEYERPYYDLYSPAKSSEQSEINILVWAKALGLKIDYSAIGQYERGTREPTLIILLKYARLAGISTDILIDDKLNLPHR